MQSLNKRGVGESVATFALILVAIGAVILAGYSVMKIMSLGDIQKSPEFKCLNDQFRLNQNDQQIRLAKACLNEDGAIQITVQRSDENVQINSLGFEIDKEMFKCGSSDTCATCQVPAPGKSETYFITPQQNPSGKTLKFYAETCKINEMKIVNC